MKVRVRFLIWKKGLDKPIYVSGVYDSLVMADEFAFNTLCNYSREDDFKDYSYELVRVLGDIL